MSDAPRKIGRMQFDLDDTGEPAIAELLESHRTRPGREDDAFDYKRLVESLHEMPVKDQTEYLFRTLSDCQRWVQWLLHHCEHYDAIAAEKPATRKQ